MVIGIVGGIGSGKSLVAQLFADHGGLVIQGDALGHEALRQPAIRDRIKARFGPDVLDANGEVVRRKLAQRVFSNDDQRRALEEIVFPYIGRRAAESIAQAQTDANVRFVVLDAAVMLEAGWNRECDQVVYVHTPRPLRLVRLAERGWTEEQTAARERAQWPLYEKIRRADAVIDNSGDPAATRRQVVGLLNEWNLDRKSDKV